MRINYSEQTEDRRKVESNFFNLMKRYKAELKSCRGVLGIFTEGTYNLRDSLIVHYYLSNEFFEASVIGSLKDKKQVNLLELELLEI